MGIIRKLSNYIEHDILKILYSSLVHPYLLYGLEAWFSTHHYVQERMIILQKRACRAVFSLEYNSHTNDYFKQMKFLKLEDLYNFQVAVFMFKTLYLNQNCYFRRALSNYESIHSHATRHSNNFILPLFTKSRSQFSIHFKMVKIWNDLPSHLRIKCSLPCFKKKLREWFLDRY